MLIRRFDKDKDYNTINDWSMQRSIGPIPKDLLPEIGFIIDDIACGFIIQTDTKMAFGEFLLSNPNTTKENRSEAIQMIMDKGFETAKELGYLIFYVNVSNPILHDRFQNSLNMYKVKENCSIFVRSL